MSRHTSPRRTLLLGLLTIALAAPFSGVGCAASPHSADNTMSLHSSLGEFHKNLRWARYEHAATQIDPTFRSRFMGRYEELGEDFHIVSLEVKKVEMDAKSDRVAAATVEVEQQWYKEPAMTVKKERYIEVWERSRVGWALHDRLKKEDWEKQQKAKKREAEEARKKAEAEKKAQASKG